MEIELPDGTVLDAPDGSDTRAVVRGYNISKLKAKDPGQYDPQSPEFKARFGPNPSVGEAFKSGAERVGAGALNLMGKMKGSTLFPMLARATGQAAPSVSSDEALNQRDEIDTAAKEAHPIARLGGEIAGGTLLTAPLGGAGAASTGAGMLTRALVAPTTRALLEGGLQGASVAKPGEQGEGAAKGAVLSAAVGKALQAGGRAVKGLVQKSEAAKALEQLAGQQGEDIFLPISQAAGDQDLPTKAAKILYQEGLSLIPGVKGQLNRQAEGGAEKFRELALKEATPTGTPLPANPGRDVQESLASIRSGFDDAHAATIDSLDFHIPPSLRSDITTRIKSVNPNVDGTTVSKALDFTAKLLLRFSDKGGKIEGSNLRIVRDQLKKALDAAPDFEKVGYQGALDSIEDMTAKRLQVQGLLPKYTDLEEPSRHLTGLEIAARSARPQSGRFTPGQLARAAKDPTQLDLAQLANETMSQSPAGTSFAGKTALGGAGVAGVAGVAGLPAAASVLVGANLLATKTAQKALMGDTAAQQAIVKLLSKHPEMAARIQQTLRAAAVMSSEGD